MQFYPSDDERLKQNNYRGKFSGEATFYARALYVVKLSRALQSLSRRAHARKLAFYFFLSSRVASSGRKRINRPDCSPGRAGVKFSFNRLSLPDCSVESLSYQRLPLIKIFLKRGAHLPTKSRDQSQPAHQRECMKSKESLVKFS